MAELIPFPKLYCGELSVTEMLGAIVDEKPDEAFVVCWKDGKTSYHSNTGDTPEILYHLNKFIHQFYNGELE